MERPFRSVAPRRPRWNTRRCRWTIRIVCPHWARSSRSVDNVQKILWVCCAAGSYLIISSARARHVERNSRNGTLWNFGACRLFRLDVRELDHLAPLLGFVRDELAEVGGR